jgi:hypothetical protein
MQVTFPDASRDWEGIEVARTKVVFALIISGCINYSKQLAVVAWRLPEPALLAVCGDV